MSWNLAKNDSDEARRIWADLEKAAAKTPEWVKAQMIKASQETVDWIEGLQSPTSKEQG